MTNNNNDPTNSITSSLNIFDQAGGEITVPSEGEVVSSSPGQSPNPQVSAAPTAGEEMINLEGVIKNHMQRISQLNEEAKAQKGMFDDSFLNNATYQEQKQKVEEAQKTLLETRYALAKQPAMLSVQTKLKELREELKDAQAALSSYVERYQQTTGSNQIENSDGQIMDIVRVTKLVKRSSKASKS